MPTPVNYSAIGKVLLVLSVVILAAGAFLFAQGTTLALVAAGAADFVVALLLIRRGARG